MEKHYSIDPGRGEKMDGCPYSVFEDGHDVKDYIVPPKGYYFVGFRFEPLTNNQIYDGKLVAQYEKASIQERFRSNLWKVLIPVFIVAVIAIVVLLAVSIFRDPKPDKPTPPKKPTETIITTTDTTDLVSESTTDSIQQIDNPVQEENDVNPELTQEMNQEAEKQQVETPTATDSNVQFKQEFWTLIHQRTIMMDPYHNLYVNYKDQVSGEEYDYLRLVILKNYATFKEWYVKLHKIPMDELQPIETITALKEKLNEINL